MDEIVRQALARWPDVPHCYGWLALDARGQWHIGENRQTITNSAMVAFINRNYLPDANGCWMFQNGPQRVYVELDYTPLVWRLLPSAFATSADHGQPQWKLAAHTGEEAGAIEAIWLDQDGRFLIRANTHNGSVTGVLHDHDSALMAEWLRAIDGTVLDEAALLDHIDSANTANTEQPLQLAVSWLGGSTLIPLQAIATSEVPLRFGFIQTPSAKQNPLQ